MFALSSLKLSLLLLPGLLTLLTASALPAEVSETHAKNVSDVSLAKEAAAVAAPHFVIYSDASTSGQIGPPPVADVKVFIQSRS